MKDTKHRPLRFVIVGISNTVLDFTLMNLLSLAGLNLIIANTISTGIAMIYSFLMNKKWTFRNAGQDYLRQVILFFIFTAIGIWVIQNGLIILAQHYLPHFGLPDQAFNNLAKLGASVFSLTWNYLTYNHFVFTDKR
jgi:hypothetical protein cdiviTM7_02105